MKKLISRSHGLTVSWTLLATALTLATLTFGAAIKEGYVTRSATTTTNTAEVFFPQNPTKAIRLAGEAIFQVQRRAPLALRLTNGLNGGMRINSATVHYDDNAP